MPHVSSVLDVLNSEDGSVILAVKGKLTALFKRNSGEGQFGPWTVQNGILSEGENKLRITVWNHPELSKFKGRTIYIQAGEVKGKPAHCTFVMGEYQGEPQPELKVEKSATISMNIPGSKGGDDEDHSNPDLEEQDPEDSAPAKKSPPKKETRDPSLPVTIGDLDIDTRRDAIRLANLRIVSERAADYCVATYAENGGKRKFTEEQVGLIATGIYISLERAGHMSAMPGKPITQPPPPPKVDNTPPPI